MMREARETELFLLDRLIDQADVICTTLVGSANDMLRDRVFDVVVIDEAGQALEPACWIPISKGNKLVLAGDHLQLPPTIFSNEAAQKGLAISLMERAARVSKGVHFLDVQYRMNEKIAAFSNMHFYEGKLTADISVARRMLEGDLNPIQFIDTAGTGYNEEAGAEGHSRMNKGEAELAMKIYTMLKEQTQQFFSCALISPYRAQIELLERVFKDEEVTINTVDSFQGQEADVVIISLVRSNDENEIGFLKDYRRMNVALTRARKKLIVIGDSATIGGDSFYQEMLQFFEVQESYESAWIYMG
jgi:predicted DNA helicase